MKKLIAIGVVATGMLFASRVLADEPPDCEFTKSDGTTVKVNNCSSTGGNPCCIYGVDKSGQEYAVATCCKGSKPTCQIRYADGSVSGAGTINGGLTVSNAGCVK
jgi:hypothetical protein